MFRVEPESRCRILFVSETGMASMCGREQMQRSDVCEEHREILKITPEKQTKWIKWSLPDREV